MSAAPEDTLSYIAGAKEILQSKYTLSADWSSDFFHTTVIRKQLITQNISDLLDDVVDELTAALTDNIPPTDGTAFCNFCLFLYFVLSSNAFLHEFRLDPSCRF